MILGFARVIAIRERIAATAKLDSALRYWDGQRDTLTTKLDKAKMPSHQSKTLYRTHASPPRDIKKTIRRTLCPQGGGRKVTRHPSSLFTTSRSCVDFAPSGETHCCVS